MKRYRLTHIADPTLTVERVESYAFPAFLAAFPELCRLYLERGWETVPAFEHFRYEEICVSREVA